MKVRLLESAHWQYAPNGAIGELEDHDGKFRFIPDTAKDHPLWIGRVKWEEVPHGTMETEHGTVPVFVEDGTDKIQVAVANALVRPQKRGK